MTTDKTLKEYQSERKKLVYDSLGITTAIVELQKVRLNKAIKIAKLDREIRGLENDRKT